MTNEPIWIPNDTEISTSNLTGFQNFLSKKTGNPFVSYAELHSFSIKSPEVFWPSIAEYCGAVANDWGSSVLTGDTMFEAKWFNDAQLNYAETMLKRRDSKDAIVFRGEDKVQSRLSFDGLYQQVSQLAQYLRAQGVTKGDRVAGFLPNIPGAIIAMLATASIGAIWSSCSPDFGRQGVLDRFGQIEPKVLFGVDGYFYNGKTHSTVAKIADFITDLPSVKSVIMFDYIGEDDLTSIKHSIRFEHAISDFSAKDIEFEQLPFDHPLFILYSSGTTGAPKCIVHGHGGTLLQHLKEHQLHSDIKTDDRVFYFSTCSWMMWNWLVSALGSGAAIMLYDGSPFYPEAQTLWQYAEKEKITFFGTSAKYLEALQKAGYAPNSNCDLSSLRAVASTGSPLSPEGYDYVYDAIGDVHLASISGGTDIVSCFALGVPTLPVKRGELQSAGLGMAVEIWDENGTAIQNKRGELVCTKPFPSRPVMFWNDPDNAKYKSAYFERFDDVWAHGDFAEIKDDGGVIIYGRSDATLNPGGVRIGTAEIYRQVDKVASVLESIVIGQKWDNDVRVVLFVKMQNDVELTDDIKAEIKTIIRENCTSRHVPAKIIAVEDIPRTKSGKIVEIPVRDVVHGLDVKNKEALANPEALEFYKNLTELSS